jgi:hypothetical protein
VTKLHTALDQIIKLHPPTKDDDRLQCTTCYGEKLASHPEWPCKTVAIAHRALNPQIPLDDIKKDALKALST